jgi:hypothetical protein
MRAKAFIQASSDPNSVGDMIEVADMQVNNENIFEGPYYVIQRDDKTTLNTIGNNNVTVPWLEIDYFGMRANVTR